MPPVQTLVRDDLQHWVAAMGAVLALATRQPLSILTCYLPGFCISQLSWFALHQPPAFYASRNFDATLLIYTASLAVWLSLGAMVCNLILSLLSESGVALPSGDGSVTQLSMTATLVALGVGAQPILNNFTSGLLLVLFRPFRVGDNVQVGDVVFTVQAITAFFVKGTTFQNVHISLPNSSVLNTATPVCNFTANKTLTLELAVHVHAGQHPCAVVRAAMDDAAAAFEARLAATLFACGIDDARAVAAALPPPAVLGPCAITDHGVQWMLKPRVPEIAWFEGIDLGNACIHDALMDAGVAIFEASDRSSLGSAADTLSDTSPSRGTRMRAAPPPTPRPRRAASAARRRAK